MSYKEDKAKDRVEAKNAIIKIKGKGNLTHMLPLATER